MMIACRFQWSSYNYLNIKFRDHYYYSFSFDVCIFIYRRYLFIADPKWHEMVLIDASSTAPTERKQNKMDIIIIISTEITNVIYVLLSLLCNNGDLKFWLV